MVVCRFIIDHDIINSQKNQVNCSTYDNDDCDHVLVSLVCKADDRNMDKCSMQRDKEPSFLALLVVTWSLMKLSSSMARQVHSYARAQLSQEMQTFFQAEECV